ncbi:hypothetical protein Sjap_018407 [Stephania japonica]|uniref:Uncharacterized protein n=1 Tax=Stephania japonica TaxID=461633 RepID=A0AAP0NJC1_9MAGN
MPTMPIVVVGPAVTEKAPAQTEIVPHTPDTLAEDAPSTPTDSGVRATPKARQAREFMRHQPLKFHEGTNL